MTQSLSEGTGGADVTAGGGTVERYGRIGQNKTKQKKKRDSDGPYLICKNFKDRGVTLICELCLVTSQMSPSTTRSVYHPRVFYRNLLTSVEVR